MEEYLDSGFEGCIGIFKMYKRKGILDTGPSICKGPEIQMALLRLRTQSQVVFLNTELNFILQIIGSPERVQKGV